MLQGRWNGHGIAKKDLNSMQDVLTSAEQHCLISEKPLYSYLTRYSNEKCLFCRRLFFNKLQLYMHNTTHLYIPVEKLELSECIIKALNTSQEPVTKNMPEKSHTRKSQHNNPNNKIKNLGFKKMFSNSYEKSQQGIKKAKIVEIDLDSDILNHKDNLLRDLMTECKVDLGENIPIQIRNNTNDINNEINNSILNDFTTATCSVNLKDFFSDIQMEPDKEPISNTCNSKMLPKSESSANPFNETFINSIKNKILQEEFSNSDNREPIRFDTANNKMVEEINEIKEPSSNNRHLVGKRTDKSEICEVKREAFSSVHYEKLVKERKCDIICKLCRKRFKNRYLAIKHEGRHLIVGIQKLDIHLGNKPHNCEACLNNFTTFELYLQHIKHCIKKPSKVELNVGSLKIKPETLIAGSLKMKPKKGRETKKIKKDTKLESIDNFNCFLKPEEKPRSSCPYCNSTSSKCSVACSGIRDNVLRSGVSTYFCKECFTKMQANLTEVGLFNGEMLAKRCVVCNGVGNYFIMAIMNSECVLGM